MYASQHRTILAAKRQCNFKSVWCGRGILLTDIVFFLGDFVHTITFLRNHVSETATVSIFSKERTYSGGPLRQTYSLSLSLSLSHCYCTIKYKQTL